MKVLKVFEILVFKEEVCSAIDSIKCAQPARRFSFLLRACCKNDYTQQLVLFGLLFDFLFQPLIGILHAVNVSDLRLQPLNLLLLRQVCYIIMEAWSKRL